MQFGGSAIFKMHYKKDLKERVSLSIIPQSICSTCEFYISATRAQVHEVRTRKGLLTPIHSVYARTQMRQQKRILWRSRDGVTGRWQVSCSPDRLPPHLLQQTVPFLFAL